MQRYVAVKVLVAEHLSQDRELTILSVLAAAQSDHPGRQHLMTMQDGFQLHGPNEIHDCLVLEMLGPSVEEKGSHVGGGRLPGKVAKTIAKQALLGLSYLHEQCICHGGRSRSTIFRTGRNHHP